MNDEVLEDQKDGDNSLKDSEPFKKQYAAVLLLLNEVNEHVWIHLISASIQFFTDHKLICCN